jgi:hypothetical protein
MGRGGRFLGMALLVLIATFSLFGAHVDIAQAASNPFNGTWNCCGAGGAAQQVFVINGNTGVADTPGGGEFATITASYNYPLTQITTTYTDSSYVATFKGSITPDGQTITGTWTSNQGQSGTFTATKGTPSTGPPTVSIVISSPNFHVGQNVTATVTVTAGTEAIIDASLGAGPTLQGGYASVSPPPAGSNAINLEPNTSQSFVYTLTGKSLGGGLVTVSLSSANPGAPVTTAATTKFDVIGALNAVPSPDLGPHAAPAPIASTLGTPGEIFHSPGHNLVNAGITVAAILFITFPANIFNNTFASNYAEILLILANFRRRVRRAFGLKDRGASTDSKELPAAPVSSGVPAAISDQKLTTVNAPGATSRSWFYGVLILGAILGGLLNPHFGLNKQSATDFGATMVSFAIGAILSWYIAKVFREHHKYPTHTYLHALPLGLGVAALCVIISRLTSFEPGYLYGVVVSIAFVESLEERHNAHLTLISTFSTLIAALLAWFAWIPINHLALNHTGNIPLGLVDDVLGSIFVGGLVGTVVGLMPLQFMAGGTLLRWRKEIWAVVFFISLFLLVEVELNPASGPTHHGSAPLVTALVLFVGFGSATLWMRRYFAKRLAAKNAVLPLTPVSTGSTPSGATTLLDAPAALEPGEDDDSE